jgi:hypothetical protein
MDKPSRWIERRLVCKKKAAPPYLERDDALPLVVTLKTCHFCNMRTSPHSGTQSFLHIDTVYRLVEVPACLGSEALLQMPPFCLRALLTRLQFFSEE